MIGSQQMHSEHGNIPSICLPDMSARGMGRPMECTASGYGRYYGGNIPSTTYSPLHGACQLELPSVAAINRAQLTKAKELAEENPANVLGIMYELPAVSVQKDKGQELVEQILANEKSKEALQGLDNIKDNHEGKG